MARRYRPRKLFKFWLYHDLAEDTRLMEYIQYLHKTRQFATMIRNGLRLMWTLGEGDTSVLFELFPTLRSQFAPDNTALLEEFRQMLQAQVALVPQFAQGQSAANRSAHALPAPRVAEPARDEEDTLVIKKDTSGKINPTANFLAAAFGLRGEDVPTFGNDDTNGESVDLPDDDALETQTGSLPGCTGKPIPGAKDIPMPTFDEDDDDELSPVALKKLI